METMSSVDIVRKLNQQEMMRVGPTGAAFPDVNHYGIANVSTLEPFVLMIRRHLST